MTTRDPTELTQREQERRQLYQESPEKTKLEILEDLGMDLPPGYEPVESDDMVPGWSSVSPDEYEVVTVQTQDAITTNWAEMVSYAVPGIFDPEIGLAAWWPGLSTESPYPAGAWDGPAASINIEQAWLPESWEMGAQTFGFTDPSTGDSASFWVRYDPSRASQQWHAMSGDRRLELTNQMVASGLLPKEWANVSDYTIEGAAAFGEALAAANYYGKPVGEVLTLISKTRPPTRGSGSRGPTFKAEIPDYETMLFNSENLLKQTLGRDPEDWEMSLIADEMKDQYGAWAKAKERAALGGNGVYEVPDPQALTVNYLQDTYSSEINRIQTREETRVNNALTLNALTKGRRMIGSYGA